MKLVKIIKDKDLNVTYGFNFKIGTRRYSCNIFYTPLEPMDGLSIYAGYDEAYLSGKPIELN